MTYSKKYDNLSKEKIKKYFAVMVNAPIFIAQGKLSVSTVIELIKIISGKG